MSHKNTDGSHKGGGHDMIDASLILARRVLESHRGLTLDNVADEARGVGGEGEAEAACLTIEKAREILELDALETRCSNDVAEGLDDEQN